MEKDIILTVALNLAKKQLAIDKIMDILSDLRIDVDPLNPGLFDDIADLLGVPTDNTVETNACGRANTTGVWPTDAYCRDWVYNLWGEVVRGEITPEMYIKKLQE